MATCTRKVLIWCYHLTRYKRGCLFHLCFLISWLRLKSFLKHQWNVWGLQIYNWQFFTFMDRTSIRRKNLTVSKIIPRRTMDVFPINYYHSQLPRISAKLLYLMIIKITYLSLVSKTHIKSRCKKSQTKFSYFMVR
jgi:hypothetical protein